MAAGQVIVLDRALRKLADGTFDLDSQSFKVALLGDDQALAASFAGGSGNALYSDLTDEVVGSGYTAGGASLVSPAWTRLGAVVSFTADPTVWTSLTAQMKYAAIYLDGGAGDILCYFDLETTDPSGRTSSGGDFTINWTGSVFTLTRV